MTKMAELGVVAFKLFTGGVAPPGMYPASTTASCSTRCAGPPLWDAPPPSTASTPRSSTGRPTG